LGLTSVEDGGIVNLATGRLATVREFVEIAAGILGIPPENLNFGALPPSIYEMEHAPVAINRLKTLLGWLPPTTIAEGVRKTLEIGLL
jgi:nucleoside-diphosphate-sugar epimerase